MKTFKNYFDDKFPNDSSSSRKIRIGIEAFKRILKDSPKIDISVAGDMAMKLAKINIGDSEWVNFVSQVIKHRTS